MTGEDLPNGNPGENIKQAALEWEQRNDILSHDEFRLLKREIADGLGASGVGNDTLCIEGDAAELGEIAAQFDIALAEVGDNTNMGHLRGVHITNGCVAPVLVCINNELWERLGTGFDEVIRQSQPGDDKRLPVADGAGLEAPGHNPGTPPGGLVSEDRWFCMTVVDGVKQPRAAWCEESPYDDYTPGWDDPVGHNWPGVKTDYETAKGWADHIDSWFLATKIGSPDDREEHRLHLFDFDNCRDPESGEIHPAVSEFIDRVDSYGQVSYSGTGVHVYAHGPVPEGYKETGFEAELSDWKHADKFEEPAHVEGYSRKRFIAITEKHLDSTPQNVETRPEEIEWVYDNWGVEADDRDDPDFYESTEDREPTHTKSDIRTTETTSDWDMIFDAIAHAKPRCANGGVRLRSSVTNDRPSGIIDLDPSWSSSESGTRLGYDDGFIYRKGDVGLDILQVVALEERIILSEREYPEGEEFHEAVEALRKRGASIPEYEPPDEGMDTSMLPIKRLDALSHDERVRWAKKRGIDWPNVDQVRERLDNEIRDAIEEGRVEVIASPTGSGKTYSGSTTPWKALPEVTGDQPVIHAHKTREARDQAAGESEEAGLDYYVLKGRHELCPMAMGHYDHDNTFGNEPITIDGMDLSEWIDMRCQGQGLPFSVVHGWLEDRIDGGCPCQRDGTDCPSKNQFENIPRNDDGEPAMDVIHCTHEFLHVPGLRMHTNILFDEKPSFDLDITPTRVRDAVNCYLRYIDAPVDSYNELVYAAENGEPPGTADRNVIEGVTHAEWVDGFEERMTEALDGANKTVECSHCRGTGEPQREVEDTLDVREHPAEEKLAEGHCGNCHGRGEEVIQQGRPPLSWYRDNHDAHALAPALAKAIWAIDGDQKAEGRMSARVNYEPPRFDAQAHDHDGWNRVHVDVVVSDQYEVIEANSCPDFSLARSVVGLDAHPQPEDPYWQVNVSPEMQTNEILDTQERSLYRRYERGLFTVQIGENTQPVTNGQWLDKGQGRRFDVLVKHMRDEYGESFDSAITSIAAKNHVRQSMVDAGVEEPELMHYGNEESRNDFAGKDVGLVIGAIDPGDNPILNLMARLGHEVEVPTTTCDHCDGTGHVEEDGELEPCDHCGGNGEHRTKGREFTGPDAEKAAAALKGIREHHVAQSAGRWAREADNDDDNAIVYIATDATPTGFIDAKVPGVTWLQNPAQKERLEYVRDNPDGVTAREIAEKFDCAKETARRTLVKAAEEGIVERTPGAGPYGADVFCPDAGVDAGGSVDLCNGADGSATTAYRDNDTWVVAVESHLHTPADDPRGVADDWQYQATFEWFEPGVEPPS